MTAITDSNFAALATNQRFTYTEIPSGEDDSPVSLVPSYFGPNKEQVHTGWASIVVPVFTSLIGGAGIPCKWTYTPLIMVGNKTVNSSPVFERKLEGAIIEVFAPLAILGFGEQNMKFVWRVEADDTEPTTADKVIWEIQSSLGDYMAVGTNSGGQYVLDFDNLPNTLKAIEEVSGNLQFK